MTTPATLKTTQEVEAFIQQWPGEEQPMRDWFELLYAEIKLLNKVELQFVARPGVSYSLRPKHQAQSDRELFAMIDVIDDDPQARWLSVCFYGDMITDPKQLGEVIPGGLAGADGYCFDMFDNDSALAAYLVERLHEAASVAATSV
jgi:hypothetical protein